MPEEPETLRADQKVIKIPAHIDKEIWNQDWTKRTPDREEDILRDLPGSFRGYNNDFEDARLNNGTT